MNLSRLWQPFGNKGQSRHPLVNLVQLRQPLGNLGGLRQPLVTIDCSCRPLANPGFPNNPLWILVVPSPNPNWPLRPLATTPCRPSNFRDHQLSFEQSRTSALRYSSAILEFWSLCSATFWSLQQPKIWGFNIGQTCRIFKSRTPANPGLD